MPDFSRYDQIRKTQKNANSVLLDTLPKGPVGKAIIHGAAKALNYRLRDGAIVFPSDASVDRLYEFLLYEPRINGVIWAQHVLDSENPLSPPEREVVRAVLAARTSLFEVAHVNRAESSILLHDLLQNSTDIRIVDRGLGSTIGNRSLIFGRCVSMDGVHFLSGSSVGFGANEKSLLLAKTAKLSHIKNSGLLRRKRFALFVDLEKYSSLSVRYE